MDQNEKYSAWIEQHYPTESSAYGQCQEACEFMSKEFPELRVTNGFVHVFAWNKDREHWWLVDSEGKIVDPTKKQFPGLISYKEIDDSHPARNYEKSRCRNCGEYYYVTPGKDATVCGDSCYEEFAKYLNGGSRKRAK